MALTPKLGIIAANGRFPLLVLNAARARGYEGTVAEIHALLASFQVLC